jgi:hypothetical protein
MLVINGEVWNIQYVDRNSNYLRRSDGSFTPGVCNISTHTIYIFDELQGDFLKKVLTHEICHCSMASYKIYVPLETEELICDFLATYGEEVIGIADLFFNTISNVL